jgi:hypothetical protein
MTLPFLNQGGICRMVSRLRAHNKKHLESRSTLIGGIVLGGLVLMLSVKLLLLPRIDNAVALIFVLCVVFGAFKTFRQALKDTKSSRDTLSETPMSHIEQWQTQLVIIFLAPILGARAISLCLSLADVSKDHPLWWGGGIAISALFLAMLKPKRELFVGVCHRCKHPVPIVFVEFGSCPLCDETVGNQRADSVR